MTLFLFTNFFPYKRSEPFLVTEFEFAKNYFNEISVFSLYGNPADARAMSDAPVQLIPPVFSNASDKKKIFLKGLFCMAPFGFHLKELFSRPVLFSTNKFRWFFISFCVSRAVRSSPGYKQLVNQIKRTEKSVLYFYWGDNMAWIIPYLKKGVGNKAIIILRLHGSDLYEHIKGNYAPLRREIFSATDKIFTVSENGSDYLKQRYPEFANKINVSRLGVKDHGLANWQGSKTLRILSVSNLVPLKRVHLIFESLQLLQLPVEWHHFGDGPLMQDLKEFTSNSPKDVVVQLHGYKSNDDLMGILKSQPFDLFVNVSKSEGLPVSIMEAFSFGIPALATNVGGISELVTATSDCLLPADLTAQLLAQKLYWFYNLSTDKKMEMRSAVRRIYEERVSAENNYSAFYKTLIERV